MNATYISIEKNIEGFEYYKKLWSNRGIIGIRADTMAEGIEAAAAVENSKTQSLYFVDIVADDIDFMPQLAVLYEKINAPILIATSKYNVNEHHKALDNGAYFYGQYNEDAESNINVVIMMADRYHHTKDQQPETNILTNGGISISISERQTFVNGTEVILTKIEFDMLHYFMGKRGQALSYEEIYSQVWGDKYNALIKEAIKGVIKRLRKKITDNENDDSLIQNVRGYGYKMPL